MKRRKSTSKSLGRNPDTGEPWTPAEREARASEFNTESLRFSAEATRAADAGDCPSAVRKLLHAGEALAMRRAQQDEEPNIEPKYSQRASQDFDATVERVVKACVIGRRK